MKAIVALLLVAPAATAQNLLLTYHDTRGTFDSPSLNAWLEIPGTPTKFNHTWWYCDLACRNGTIPQEPLPADGTTYHASAATVTALNNCLQSTGCPLNIVTGSIGRSGDKWFSSSNDLWNWQNQAADTLRVTVYNRGTVRAITRTVSGAEINWTGRYYNGTITQTINFWDGPIVPEPTSSVLCLAATAIGLLAARRRN